MAIVAIKFFDLVPVRFNLWVMLFTSCWVANMLRVNMSLNLIAMVPQTKSNSSSRSQCEPRDQLSNAILHHVDIADVREAPRQVPGGGLFEWSSDEQALILGSYFWCYPVTSLVGGMAAERWGPRYVVLFSSIASAILTMLSPVAARISYVALVVVRFFLGSAGGLIYPALHVLVARWAPPAEKGKFVSALMGGTLGTVATWSLTGPLMEKFGWALGFYVPGALTTVWCAFWWYLVADTPTDHPRISDAERKYILEALSDKVKKSKGLPPFKSIITSFPFLAMVVLHYGNLWGLYFIMTVGPKFVSSVLGFELSAAGVVSALPYLARLFLATIFGAIGDCILAKRFMTTTTIRKFFCLFSHIIPGILLVALVYAGCSTALSVALITLSMGVNGAATLTNLQNHQDLAPNYAGTLYGVANFVGSTAGFFTPMITAYLTRNGNSFEQWRPVFFVGASVYVVSAVFFILFGTGNIQSWNFEKDQTEVKEDKEKNGDLKEMNGSPERKGDAKDVKEKSLTVVPGGGLFEWSSDEQALILGSYFWCYPVTSLVGGMAAERWGPRYVVLFSSIASAILTMLSPVAARISYVALVVVRFFLGSAGGLIYPALHVLVARWAPPAEKGKFVSALMGGTLGTVATWSLTGPLMEKFGWALGFYVPGALTTVWCAFWWYLVADTPTDHPRISDAERKYILEALSDKVKKSKGLPPFKSIITSFPFLAMVVLHYGNLWGLYFIMTVGPKFVSSVLGFELSAAGVVSALPYLARLFLATIFGAIGDCILAKRFMTTTTIRKFFCLFSHIIPGILLVALVYAGCSTALSVALITLSMGVNGAATLTNLQNHQDLAPNYAGTLYGVANFVGSTAGFFTPMITAYFTRNGNSFEQWRPVFFVGASVYVVSAVFFILFGTGNIQSWNFEKDQTEVKEDKEKNGDLKEMNGSPERKGDAKDVKEKSLTVVS